MSDVISMEGLNKPSVPIVNRDFVPDGRSNASIQGIPGVRIVIETIPCECSITDQIEAGVDTIMDDIVAALIEPLTAEEETPKPMEVEKPPRILFKGTLGEVQKYFYRRGWTDGLPVLPPTDGAVGEMLTGTDLPPDQVIGRLEPRLGKATVEKIAINAVMAGALPTYMPVLIAAVQILAKPESGFGGWSVSTGSWTPFWVINGPLRNDLRVNSSSGALSPDNIANATIGRAMRLIIRNLGGARKGIEDMGVIGNPGKYTMVIAENEEESPWESFHVEQGYDKEDNTISLTSPNSYWQMMPYGTDDTGILRAAAYNIPPTLGGVLCLILNPTHARYLASKGWTKKDVVSFISEHARAPLYQSPRYYGSVPSTTGPESGMLLVNPEDSIQVVSTKGSFRIVVAGGSGNIMGILAGAPFHTWTMEKIQLPANWEKLVKKYKDMVPAYIKY